MSIRRLATSYQFEVQLPLTSKFLCRGSATKATNQTPSLDPLESLARARSLITPSEAFPATQGDIKGPGDAKIQWREHWDTETSSPYYENLVTREVTFKIPQGLPTRFGSYWVRKGHNISEDLVQPKSVAKGSSLKTSTGTQMRQFSTSSHLKKPAEVPEGTDPSKMTLKQRIGMYGTAGLALYLIIHNTILVIIFILLYVFEVDLVTIARGWGYELKFLSKTKNDADESSNTSSEGQTKDRSLIATFVTAVALCKMVVPFQLALTLALCPTLAPRLNVLITKWRAKVGHTPPLSVTPPV